MTDADFELLVAVCDTRAEAQRLRDAIERPEPPVTVTMTWPDGSPRRVACARCGRRLSAQQASNGCPAGCT